MFEIPHPHSSCIQIHNERFWGGRHESATCQAMKEPFGCTRYWLYLPHHIKKILIGKNRHINFIIYYYYFTNFQIVRGLFGKGFWVILFDCF